MPQPVRKKCDVLLMGLEKRPEHAAVLGIIVSLSGRLEAALGWLLALLSRGSATITMSMFHAVASTDAQKAMLLAAAKHSLSGPELDAFNELMEDFRPRYGERSRVVHNLWGYSDEHPDKAIWCKASDMGSGFAKIAAAPDIAAMNQIVEAEELSLKCMLYSVQDLKDIQLRLQEYTFRITSFIGELYRVHPVLAVAANAATDAQPIGEAPQLDLPQNPRTDP